MNDADETHNQRLKDSDAQSKQLKIVLLSLGGDTTRVCATLKERYPEASLETISRAEIQGGGFAARLNVLRARRPDVFGVATERLAWQRGQHFFLLYGALAGAHRSLILDAHGGLKEEERTRTLLRAPLRLAREAGLSAAILARARRELRKLEREVERATARPRRITASTRAENKIDVVYLRATPGAGTSVGGASSHINGVVNALLGLGARVRFISNDPIAGVDQSKTPLTIIEPEPVGATRAIFDIHNNAVFTRGATPLIERAPPDLIYQRYARFGWAGVVASLRTGRPLFLEFNGSEVWVGRHWDHVGMLDLLARYERLNLDAAERIFVVSDVERRNLERAGIASEKIIVNPNGVDTETFRPQVGGACVRQALNVADEEMLVGFVGTFGPWHGVLVLAEAIKLLPADARIRFLLIGGGVLLEEFRRIVREGGAEGRVIMAGIIGHERVPAMLDACDVLISPHVPFTDGSEFFGSPTKLFEYMAMGKGIVASRLGQIGDVLTDGETALLVEPGDARELSDALLRLSASQGLRERLGAAARKEAVARHTWKHNAERVLRAYSASGSHEAS